MRYLRIVLCLVVFCCAFQAHAAERKAGIVRKAEGVVFVDRQGKLSPLKEGDTLYEKDTVVTRAGSVGIVMKDDSVMSVGSNSRLTVSEFVFEPAEKKYSLVTRLKQGTMVYLTGLIAKLNRSAIRLETPTAVAGVRGTHVAIKVEGHE